MSPILMMGWFTAPWAVRVNCGANFLKGSSRYCSQRPSGSMVWRSLSSTRNPFFMAASSAVGVTTSAASRGERDQRAQNTQEQDVHGEAPHGGQEIGPGRPEQEHAERDRQDPR